MYGNSSLSPVWHPCQYFILIRVHNSPHNPGISKTNSQLQLSLWVFIYFCVGFSQGFPLVLWLFLCMKTFLVHQPVSQLTQPLFHFLILVSLCQVSCCKHSHGHEFQKPQFGVASPMGGGWCGTRKKILTRSQRKISVFNSYIVLCNNTMYK